MLKFLIILVLILYVFYKTAGFLFRLVFGNLRSDPGHFNNRNHQQSRKAPGTNLNIDKVPQGQAKKDGTFKGGEYVDFEEVK